MMARRLLALIILPALVLVGSLILPSERASALLTASPTATYDPLVEPPLPPNPTELEWGKNLYWHWCMPCHGDKGQGLTDEFRMIWEPDHQNCWGRGCHGGLPRDEGFPIPTVVPALRRADQLDQFISVQQLDEYLAKTHPPQSPGILKPEEYQAIAAYLFSMNERSAEELPSATATPTDIPTPAADEPEAPHPGLLIAGLFIAVLLVGGFIVLRGRRQGAQH